VAAEDRVDDLPADRGVVLRLPLIMDVGVPVVDVGVLMFPSLGRTSTKESSSKDIVVVVVVVVAVL
jgi:hypothetical protein